MSFEINDVRRVLIEETSHKEVVFSRAITYKGASWIPTYGFFVKPRPQKYDRNLKENTIKLLNKHGFEVESLPYRRGAFITVNDSNELNHMFNGKWNLRYALRD